ncbi:MAG: alpha/beta fold hydrolase [Rectinemataceae bacterium]|nr:alpha/beta hydrolase [Spirochaetaceae bacterium]
MSEIFVNGVHLTYELTGKEFQTERIPLVFLNGIAMTIGHWKPVLERLPEPCCCLCHDMRGQTLSEKPAGPYSLALHADDLAALMEAVGLARGYIVGTSYGAEVGMEFALRYPERCAGLMVIDGVSEYDALLRAAVESWMAAAASDPRVFYKTILPWNYSPGFIAARQEMLAAREEGVARLPPEWFAAFIELCKAFLAIDLTPRLGAIACPTTVLVGEKDILKHKGYADIIARGIPGAVEHVIPGAGHAVVIERPDLIAEELWKAVCLL